MNVNATTNAQARRAAQHEVWASALQGLRRHLPALETTHAELAHSVRQLDLPHGTATRIYAWSGLHTLADLNATVVPALAWERDVSAQTLAQSAMHLAVNVLYVMGDPGGDRLTGTLRQLLDAQHARFTAWATAVPDQRDQARAYAEHAAAVRQQSPWYASAPDWPPLAARADAADVGHWVHGVLAKVERVDETLAQGVMDYLSCERGTPEAREAAHAYRSARCASDALYTASVASRLFAEAVHRYATMVADPVAITVAASAIERMDTVLADHHQLADAHRHDTSVYMKVRVG